MLRHAFPAIVTGAARTAHDSLALRVDNTFLKKEIHWRMAGFDSATVHYQGFSLAAAFRIVASLE
jgi:hypothetical protein